MEKRIASVLACQYVDEVIPNAPWYFDPAWIEKYDIGLVVHGDDYSDQRQRDMYKVPIEKGIFRTVPYTKGISTTEIISRNLERKVGAETALFTNPERIEKLIRT
jgi:glycerol-3-phosphate cytidylyltransferase-like family protein